MNAKHAKLLRKTARNESPAGEPVSRLVMFKQLCNPWYNPTTKKSEPRTAYCAVNSPFSFRGRYRNLKSGRVIDIRRIEAAGREIEAYQARVAAAEAAGEVDGSKHYAKGGVTPPKKNWLQKMAARFNRTFRHQAR
jgi:hypothetical protein